jgi:RND family efflux transporter MFP subunit
MKNLLYIWAFLLVTGGTISCQSKAETQKSEVQSEAIAVNLISVNELEIETEIKGSGLLYTENETRHAFKIGGIIDRIFVSEGQHFKAGQLLASLKMVEIEAGYAQAQLGLDKAKRDHQRVQNLFADSVATLEQLQNSKTALELAEQQLTSVAFNKQYAFIYAEKAGFVVKKLANEGEVINGGMPVLASSENGSSSWELKIGLSDREWAKVAIGNKAKVMLDAYPNRWWDAHVSRKSGAADQGTGSFQVELKLENLSESAALGMFGSALIYTGKKQSNKLVPFQALVEANGNNAFVFIPEGEHKVRKQAVKIDGFSEEGVRIIHGLEGVDAIVLGNSAFLNASSTIQIIK